ncbi:MAG: hypothetical protein BroJett018_51130 [Chloroflexota bacterium]|nr:MAG: hypothetical protein BroJett018_51130 [Chloroflexota bacterium]
METPDRLRIYFAGDTALFGDMRLIGELYRPHIAVLPIGDRFTMGPREAAYAVRLLGVSHVIPMHYAAFEHSCTATRRNVGRQRDWRGIILYNKRKWP